MNTYISLCGDGSKPEHLENYSLGCPDVSYNGALRPEISGTVWPRFSHTRGDTYEAQCFVFEEPMLESAKHGNPNSRCVEVVSSIEEVTKPS